MRWLFILLLGIVFISGCDFGNKVIINDIVVKVEIADNDEERMKGLMFRESLGENDGMLFIFEDSEMRTFWMKNTLIPLDIIFISEDFRIINIEEAIPCEEEPCGLYKSDDKARYVLEVNQGLSEEKGIKPGDLVRI